jgi:hypothetical protein
MAIRDGSDVAMINGAILQNRDGLLEALAMRNFQRYRLKVSRGGDVCFALRILAVLHSHEPDPEPQHSLQRFARFQHRNAQAPRNPFEIAAEATGLHKAMNRETYQRLRIFGSEAPAGKFRANHEAEFEPAFVGGQEHEPAY